jgi:hypothetical protein
MNENVTKALKAASDGLSLPSESDEPIEPIGWDKSGDLSEPDVLRLSGHKPGDHIETTTLDDIFRDALAGEDAPKFKSLIQTLKGSLSDLRAYRIGDVEKDVYIMGKTKDGKWAGLKSKVVET